MDLLQLILASVFFAAGGLFMKLSDGATRPLPTVAFSVLFLGGAFLQAWAMRHADLGAAYIAVLGMEAVLTLVFSAGLLHEKYSVTRLAAVLLIIAGVVLLRRTT